MEIIRKINDELAIAGQIAPEQLQQLAQEGYRSVLNLRSSSELGFLSNEQQQAEALGLHYVNMPIEFETTNDEIATKLFQQINQLSKPTLVHCDTGIRSAAIVLMHIAVRQGATLKQAFQHVNQLGLFGVFTSTKIPNQPIDCAAHSRS
jgi:uncharacterized protein (TIGR01244 family)